MKTNRTCKTCGTKYEYCPKCGADRFKPTWMSMFCSANCYGTFSTLVDFSNEKKSKEEAKKELSKLDTTKVTNEVMKKQIADIMGSAKKTSGEVQATK